VGWKLPAVTVLLWAVAITVIGAALGVVFGGPLDALAGPIAGTVAGFIPALRDDARQRRAELAAREASAAQAEAGFEAVGEPSVERPEAGLSGLLCAV
jgi:uncharacterized membrane protein YphA (DoxX/SURF4 family)